MPWCPKCQNEYVEGVKVCADCGCTLVATLEEASATPLIFGEKEQMEGIKEFLEYNKLTSVSIKYDEKENVYELYVSSEEDKKARKMAAIYLQQEAESQTELIEEEEEEQIQTAPVKTYVNSAQKAEENKASGYTLLGVGIAGTIFMILIWTGVLPLHMSGTTKVMSGVVMEALFVVFMVMGIQAFRSSKQLEARAKSETGLTESMKQWCKNTLKADELDAEILTEGEALTDEVKYFRRTELLKAKINAQFMNLDESFLDQFVDDIYESVFES